MFVVQNEETGKFQLTKLTKNVIIFTLLIIFAILFRIFALSRIPVNTVGVKVSSLTGVQSKTLKTGYHLRIPFVDRVYLMPTSVQTRNLENLTTQTKDGQFLNTTVDVKYRVRESEAMVVFKDYTTMENVKEQAIAPAVQRAIESVTGDYDAFDILGTKRTEVYNKIDSNLRESLKSYNLDFVSFTIIDQDAGDEIEQAIREEAIKQKQVDSARQDQEKVKIETETAKLKAQAEADAMIIKAEGQAKANQTIANSITDNIIRMKEAEAREKHGWIEVQGVDQAIVDATKE